MTRQILSRSKDFDHFLSRTDKRACLCICNVFCLIFLYSTLIVAQSNSDDQRTIAGNGIFKFLNQILNKFSKKWTTLGAHNGGSLRIAIWNVESVLAKGTNAKSILTTGDQSNRFGPFINNLAPCPRQAANSVQREMTLFKRREWKFQESD